MLVDLIYVLYVCVWKVFLGKIWKINWNKKIKVTVTKKKENLYENGKISSANLRFFFGELKLRFKENMEKKMFLLYYSLW